MAELEHFIAVLFKFLAASLIIERLLEYLNKLFYFGGLIGGSGNVLAVLLGIQLDPEQEEKRRLRKMIVMQTFGFLGGIAICRQGHLGIFTQLGIINAAQVPWWDVLLSGVLISGGSEPIHQMISFLNEKKERVKKERLKAEVRQIEKAPQAKKPGGFARLEIEYKGGLYPDKPGHALRKVNPRYIVLHHSGTSQRLSFEDIVRLEKTPRSNDRGTYTLDPSYHCVVTYDGKYHNYCRWDSVGWHMARSPRISNSNSLGLCVVGNFNLSKEEKNNQRKVNQRRPSEGQINTAARIIALWRILYGIDEKNVVAHYRSSRGARSACPGNNFPLERLVAKSTQFIKAWEKDEQIQAEIEQFKKLKYLYV